MWLESDAYTRSSKSTTMPEPVASTIAVTSDDPKKKKVEETDEKDKDAKKEGSSKLKEGEKDVDEMVWCI